MLGALRSLCLTAAAVSVLQRGTVLDALRSYNTCLYTPQMQQYQYYSVGLLSNYDKFYEHQKMVVGPKKKLSKEQRKLEKKLMKGACRVVSIFAGLSSILTSGHGNNLCQITMLLVTHLLSLRLLIKVVCGRYFERPIIYTRRHMSNAIVCS